MPYCVNRLFDICHNLSVKVERSPSALVKKKQGFIYFLACLLAPTPTPKYYLDQFDQNHCVKFVGSKRLPFICTLMKIHTADYVALHPE